jgi:hypothetical protein
MHDRSKTMCENVKPGRDPQGPATPAGKNRFPSLRDLKGRRPPLC